MELLRQAIVYVFPEAEGTTLAPDTKLTEIPGWDSMNAINVLLQLQMLTGRADLQLIFNSNLRICDLVESLRSQGVAV